MTTIPNPDDPDTEGKTVPPYDGRKSAADVGGPEEATQDGAHTGGAGRPVEAETDEVDDPTQTERDQHASPPGTGRAEDRS